MSYALFGSKTSPFVRRVRMLLEGIPYELKELNPYDGQDAVVLNKINPINQIPVFTHNEITLWDSRQIFNYLNNIHHFQKMQWQDENLLTAIEGMMNAGIALMQLKRSGISLEADYMFVNRSKERVESILEYLKPFMTGEGLQAWNFHSMSIYCFIEWAVFREIISIENRPVCQKFIQAHQARPVVSLTQIPLG
jgi:glutathione S-transferase